MKEYTFRITTKSKISSDENNDLFSLVEIILRGKLKTMRLVQNE